MAVNKTECYRVVTIGYLKSFIGTNIQNSSNGSALSISRTDDTYCPTYSELTGGTIIQTWSQGSTPNGDRDGITVNSTAVLGGSYAANQLVDQRDLGLKYTRFSGLTISVGKTSFDTCGDSTSVGYSHKYLRYTKSMNDSCVTGTSSTEASDTTCGELTWHPSIGSVSNCSTYSIGKNSSSSGTAPARSISLYAHIVFRGTTNNSNTINMSQAALTGSYATEVSTYTVTTSVTASRSSSASFGCAGGTYSATGTRYYDNYSRRKWVDNCGQDYPSITADTKTSSSSSSLGSQSGSFSSWDCCNGGHNDSASLSFSYDGYSDSVSFSQSCADCSSSSSCQPEPPAPPHTGDTPVEPQYSFAPNYPDSSGVVVDRGKKNYGIRGTDNGAEIRRARGGCSSCLAAGTEFIFVAPEVNGWDAESTSDMIRVNTIYVMLNGTKVNLRDFTQSNKLDLGDGVKIWFKEHDTDQGWYSGTTPSSSNACNTIQIEFSPNTSSNWRTIKIELATDDEYMSRWYDSGGNLYSGYSEQMLASSWEYHIWQAPRGCNISYTDETGNYPGETHSGWAHCG